MLSEIGSSFWIDPNKEYSLIEGLSPRLFGVSFSDFAWLSTGRSAITHAIEAVLRDNPESVRRAVLPAYTCESVVMPFLRNGCKVDYFSLNEKLEPDLAEIKKIIESTKPDIFLFHQYFGFDTIKKVDEIVSFCREHNVTVIEDRTQCLYSDVPLSDADYCIGSIRKWCGVPDGGFIACRKGTIERKPTEKNLEFENIQLEASYAKYDYLFNGKGNKETFLKKYAQAEEMLDNQEDTYCISDISLAVQSSLDVQELKAKRRQNYEALFNGLENVNGLKPLFGPLPQEVTPLYFPVIAEDRREIQCKLREESIYAPVIWPKSEEVKINSVATQYLYEHLLCIPIDQRYTTEYMQKIIECLGKVEND